MAGRPKEEARGTCSRANAEPTFRKIVRRNRSLRAKEPRTGTQTELLSRLAIGNRTPGQEQRCSGPKTGKGWKQGASRTQARLEPNEAARPLQEPDWGPAESSDAEGRETREGENEAARLRTIPIRPKEKAEPSGQADDRGKVGAGGNTGPHHFWGPHAVAGEPMRREAHFKASPYAADEALASSRTCDPSHL